MSELLMVLGYWCHTVEFVVRACTLVKYVELEGSTERFLDGVEVTSWPNAIRDLQTESRTRNLARIFWRASRFQNLARPSEDIIHDILCGSRSAPGALIGRLQVTFRLPDVSLVHSISREACSSDSVVDTGRLININIFRIVLYANRKFAQVRSGTGKNNWTVKTLGIWSISACLLRAGQGV